MLEKYLRKFRNKRRFMTESTSKIYADEQVNQVSILYSVKGTKLTMFMRINRPWTLFQ
jgi:hypothetical protein